MAQVRDRQGRITTVSGTTADKLVQAGTHSYVKTGLTTPGKSGTLVDSGGGDSWWERNISDPFLRSIGFGGLTQTFTPQPYAQAVHTATFGREEDRLDWEASTDLVQPWRHSTNFTDEEQAQMDRYIDHSFGEGNAPQYDSDGNMISGGYASWWSVTQATNPDGSPAWNEDGSPVLGQKLKANMGDWNIENDGEAKGWTDDMIAWVSNEYTDAAGGDIREAKPGMHLWEPPTTGGGGGGGGGPKYVSPMREVVEDTVKAMLTTLTGSPTDGLIEQRADQFMKAHREQWDVRRAGGEDIDPNQVVLEAIRAQDDYLAAHAQRGDADEMRWIPERRERLKQLGVRSQDADERAIWLAQAGTALPDIETGAFQASKGRKDITLFNKLQRTAMNVVGQL